jgi:tyrosine-specific transport protein
MSVAGAVALITGTTIGAGSLALPSAALPAGFEPTAAVLLGTWALLLGEGLLLAEVNVALMRRRGDGSDTSTVTLAEMAGATLGPGGAALTTLLYLLLTYTVMVAYDVKLTELFGGSDAAPTAFTLFVGWLLVVGGRSGAVRALRPAMLGLLLSFVVLCAAGSAAGDPANLARSDWAGAGEVMPIAFLAMVFHKLVPTICSALGGDLGRIRTALGVGSLVPLGMLLTWSGVCLSIVPGGTGAGVGLDPLEIISTTGGPVLHAAIPAFTLGAVATSYLGNALHLSDFGRAQLRALGGRNHRAGNDARRDEAGGVRPVAALSVLMAVAPPLYVTYQHPADFLRIVEWVGAYGMTVLFGLLPPLMYLSLRQQSQEEATSEQPAWRTRGESALLGSMALASFSVAALHAQHDEAAAEVVQIAQAAMASVFG